MFIMCLCEIARYPVGNWGITLTATLYLTRIHAIFKSPENKLFDMFQKNTLLNIFIYAFLVIYA